MCAHIRPNPDITPVPGAPCWVSLSATSLDATVDFYSGVLGWTFQSAGPDTEFTIAYRDEMPIAGIGSKGHPLNVPVTWTPYFAVPSVDVAGDRIRERAATVAVGPLRFDEGRALVAADPHGAWFALWEGPVVANWHAEQHSPPARLDLRTRDAFAAAIFYAELLEWARGNGTCDVDYAEDTVRVLVHGHVAATLLGGAIEAAPDPRIRPRWEVAFYVWDVDAAVAAAESSGGTAVSADRGSGSPAVTLTDPDGALFTVRARGV
ncbi:VOC family protein [Streptomyces sp. AJS327]|uniref:VOC family protein n=1 Tax=Streptomyces sp. AJS327 TaxID=2545265 RepID=UPI0015DD7277|nr:VOC family protein [Streptomyces sp. AJS327]MBA0051000.1 VOC family protein [Streptomyces sp. AJS327]